MQHQQMREANEWMESELASSREALARSERAVGTLRYHLQIVMDSAPGVAGLMWYLMGLAIIEWLSV